MFSRINWIFPRYGKNIAIKKTLNMYNSIYCYSTKQRNILFMGSDGFSFPHLQALHDCPHLVPRLEIVTPDALVDKSENDIYHFAKENSIKVHPWSTVTADLCRQFDLGVVVSFGSLIPQDIINSFPDGMINVHPSLLPRWRGSSPIHHTILQGDEETGVCVLEISPDRFDHGAILHQTHCEVPAHATTESLQAILTKHGTRDLMHVIENFDDLQKTKVEQSKSGAKVAFKIEVKHSYLNSEDYTAEQIYRQHLALKCRRQLNFGMSAVKQTRTMNIVDVLTPKDSLNLYLTGYRLVTQTMRDQMNDARYRPGYVVSTRALRRYAFIVCKGGGVLAVENFRYAPKVFLTGKDFYNGYIHQSKSKLYVQIKKRQNGLIFDKE